MPPTFLNIPAHEKLNAIAAGAVKDPSSGNLFIPDGLSLALFQEWLPVGPTKSLVVAADQAKIGVSLSSLLDRCGRALKREFDTPTWVRIEINQVKPSGGNLYVSAIERASDGGREIAKTTAIIWSSNLNTVVAKFSSGTGMELAPGIQILVLVKVEMRAQHGFSIQIIDIDPNYTLGDREAKLKRIRLTLETSGEGKLNRSLPAPDDFFNVGVISPSGAAGLADFQTDAYMLTAAGLCTFTYFEAIFQGEKTKNSIKAAVIEAHHAHGKTPFDALVLIRGGGAASDLQWLDDEYLVRLVCRFHCPVFTGIGHESDRSILDEYANRSFGTPSKVIGHIKKVISSKAAAGYENWLQITTEIDRRINASEAKAILLVGTIEQATYRCVDNIESSSEKSFASIKTSALATIQAADLKSESLHQSIVAGSMSSLDLASKMVNLQQQNVTDRAIAAIALAESSALANYSSVHLAAKRSIDGIGEHLDSQFQSILGSVLAVTNTADIGSEREISDVKYLAKRSIQTADTQSRDLIAGILAHGVAPTLKRGFAIVKKGNTPLSSKAAADNATGEIEIVFRDGSIIVNKDN